MPLHPKLVHLPIALAVLVPLVSLGILVAWWKGALQRRTWIVALGLQAALVASAYAALQSGEQDEERVERVVPEAAIEAHEEAAEGFVVAGAAVLLVFLAAGVVRREGPARVIAAIATTGSLVVLALGYRVGQLGGELVYRHGAAAAFTEVTGAAPARLDDDD